MRMKYCVHMLKFLVIYTTQDFWLVILMQMSSKTRGFDVFIVNK